MNNSLYPGIEDQIVLPPEGIPFRTGIRGEPTSELRYLPSRFTTPVNPNVPLTPEQQANLSMTGKNAPFTHPQGTVSEAPPSSFDLMSPTEKASYYAENPMMAAVTQGAQRAFGLTSLGMLQAELNPTFVAEQHNIARGIDPTLSTPLGRPGVVDISPIAPENQIANLAMMNQEKSNEPEVSPVDVAAQVVSEISAELGTETPGTETPGTETPGTTADQSGGGGGGGGGEAPGAPGDAPSIGGSMDAAGSNNSGGGGGPSDGGDGTGDGRRRGGLIENYQSGGLMGMGDSQPQYAYAPTMMASGGLPAAAKKVQAQGRNGDSTLVHMTQGEVKGLDAIARAYGGRVTINPETGLPEANFLKSILPMVAGAALAATGVGAPMAAMLVGGGSYLMNPKQGLMGGLMAGLGAYGGAGLFGALGAAGATAPAITGTNAALQSVAATPGANLGNVAAQQAADSAMNVVAAPSSVVGGTNFAGNLAQAGRGVTALGTEAGRSAALQSLGGPMGAVQTVGSATAPMMMGGLESPNTADFGGTPTRIRPYKFTRTARPDAFTSKPGSSEKRYFDEEYTALPTTEVLRYAMGGSIEEGLKSGGMGSFDDEYGQDEYAVGGLTAFNSGGLQDGGFVVPADVVAHLGNGSTTAGQKVLARGLGARPIKGKGDGMSDSIPTTIDGKQPARVADGEAYVPAEKVKEVGPKRLYRMMEKVRQARTNNTRQAPAINPREYIPA